MKSLLDFTRLPPQDSAIILQSHYAFNRRHDSIDDMYHRPLILIVLSMLMGCSNLGPYLFLSARDREIKKYTQVIESGSDVAARARALSERGHAYSEKARYSKFFKRISEAEYLRLFNLALADQNESIALLSTDAQLFFNRAVTYYDRAGLEPSTTSKTWYDLAAKDFQQATQLDPKFVLAFDRLGLSYEATEDYERAILAYNGEAELDQYGKTRLADVYCKRGSAFLIEKKIEQAVSDLTKSVEIGSTADGCSCEPYTSLLNVYTLETKEYDKAWDLVHKAKASKKYISPELLDILMQKSGKKS